MLHEVIAIELPTASIYEIPSRSLSISALIPNSTTSLQLALFPTMTAAAGRSRVVVFAKSTSVGATPVEPGKTYPLSVLDHAMARHTLRLVFYYRPGPTMDRHRLKESLTDVLSDYPAMTGRLREEEGSWVVNCNDAGVRVLDARAEGTVEKWLATATAAEEGELVYWEPMRDPSIWSPYYVQITEFEDKGFAIGLSCTHMHADPTCAILFIKAWSDAHRRALIAHPPFFHPPALRPRSSPNTATPSAALLAVKSAASSVATAAKMSSATFCFSNEAIKSCLAELHPDSTPFEALASLFWCRTAASKGDSDTLTLAIDFRNLMHAPLPLGFYGNALHFSAITTDVTCSWLEKASAIRTHLAETEEEEYWSAINWLSSRQEKAFPMYGPELTCVRLDHVMAYEAVFEQGEDGRPVHVTCRVETVDGEGVVLVLPSPEEGDGRTVEVTLPEEVMNMILKDEAILKHGPTVMLSGRV